MITTTNLNLKKAELTDNADFTIFVNDNMDILDTEIILKSDIGHVHNYLPLAGGTVTGSVTADDGFKTGSWTIKENVDGSLGFFTT